MTRLRSIFALVLAALVASCTDTGSPTRVILIIGDGAGASYWTAASLAAESLAVEQFPIVGLVKTEASNEKITDSAAAATAYASGIRTFNGALGVDPDTNTVATVLEVARDRGWATGLVATSSVTHATPAAFASHVPDRDMHLEIARQMADAGIDVLLGGGRGYFEPADRPDGLDLLATMAAEDAVIVGQDGFHGLDTDSVTRLVGLFADDHLPGAFLRVPSLPAMTAAAIEVLDKDPNGFFLMVEGSQPDWLGHDGARLDTVAAEMLDLDNAIRVALEYQRTHPSTLIVVTADHETGGLAIQYSESGESHSGTTSERELEARYTGDSHSASMVPLFASGPGAERFGGIKDNMVIGRLLLEIVRP